MCRFLDGTFACALSCSVAESLPALAEAVARLVPTCAENVNVYFVIHDVQITVFRDQIVMTEATPCWRLLVVYGVCVVWEMYNNRSCV